VKDTQLFKVETPLKFPASATACLQFCFGLPHSVSNRLSAVVTRQRLSWFCNYNNNLNEGYGKQLM